jgi:DNA-binding NtrC family response regulator
MKSILLVDDDPGIRESLGDIFQDKGYAIDFAANGISALEMFKKKEYPLVIADLVMPGIDGKKLLDEIKKIKPETHVIVITGYRIIGKMLESFRKDIVCILEKPLDVESLLECVEKLTRD